MTSRPAAGPRTKGLRLRTTTPLLAVEADHPPVTAGTFSWPLLTVDEAALDHNVATMAGLCARAGVDHAPHVKTTMSRELFARQLAHGAWGATVAHPGQLRTVRDWAVDLEQYGSRAADGSIAGQRVFLANELLDPRDVAWLREELEASLADGAVPLTVWLYVDSPTGVALLARGFAGAPAAVRARLGVLVEVGVPGGRTGVRSPQAALDLAHAVTDAGIPVVGIAGYEGSAASGTTPDDLAAVAAYCRTLREAAELLVADGVVPAGMPVVLSAGGSSFLDVVLAELPGDLGTTPVQVVVRSGAYLTHDHGFCARMDPWERIPGAEPMQAAVTVWGQVLSTPEPGLAIVGVGRRDVSYDIDLPVALWLRRAGDDGTTAAPEPVSGLEVTALNDQHLFLRTPVGSDLAPGDVVGLGISHPCTVFDKWRVAAVVDAEDRVVEIVTTDF